MIELVGVLVLLFAGAIVGAAVASELWRRRQVQKVNGFIWALWEKDCEIARLRRLPQPAAPGVRHPDDH